jgi:sporulation integral membrane protein YlbJ
LVRIILLTVILLGGYWLYRNRQLLRKQRFHFSTYLLGLAAVLLTVFLVRFPKEAFDASIAGLEIWWHIVFPALLPFFIFARILIGLGVVHMMGVFLEPVMRPVFNVPGSGSFIMAMGFASGFPIGAILSAEIRARNMCNKTEAERLLSFTNTADPLFMCGAVAVGMLGYPAAGLTIAIAHYLSSLSLGFIMRFYKYKDRSSTVYGQGRVSSMPGRALAAMIKARREDGRPLGQLMGDAIRQSVESLLLIGGFIILFSVIIRILDVVGLVSPLGRGIEIILRWIGLSPSLGPALISGFFEIDLGCQYTALDPQAGLSDKIIASGMIIAWSGLSVHAQVASIISKTDISIVPYVFARCIHAVLAGIYTAIMIGPAEAIYGKITVPAFLRTVPESNISFWFTRTTFMINRIFVFFIILAIAALIISLIKSFQIRRRC